MPADGGPETSTAAAKKTGAQKASQARDAFKQAYDAAKKALQTPAGIRVVVHEAKLVCNMTMPDMQVNTLVVPPTRMLVEGKPLANVSDVKRDEHIKPWSCKCKLLPAGSDFLPCNYQPAGMWIPPAPAETSKASIPNLNKALGAMADAMGRGFSMAQAAGMLGNIMHESANMTADLEFGNGIGRGWLQWSFGRRTAFEAWSARNGLSPASAEANSGYLWHEMGGADGNHWTSWEGYSKEGFMQTQSVDESTRYFMSGYERPNKAVAHLDRRQQVARKLEKIAKELAVPEIAVLRCSVGGIIRIVDPNQNTKKVKV